MKLCAIDIETTGLNPQRNQILEICLVYFDTDKYPNETHTLNRFVIPREARWDDYCLKLHAKLLERWHSGNISTNSPQNKYCAVDFYRAKGDIIDFRTNCVGKDKLTLIGKNVGKFDYQFLDAMGLGDLFHHRMLDVGQMYLYKDDIEIPGLSKCRQRYIDESGESPGYEVTHTSLDDCMLAMILFMHKWRQLRGH